MDGFLWFVEIPTSTIRFSAETSTASTHAGWGAYTRFDFNSVRILFSLKHLLYGHEELYAARTKFNYYILKFWPPFYLGCKMMFFQFAKCLCHLFPTFFVNVCGTFMVMLAL